MKQISIVRHFIFITFLIAILASDCIGEDKDVRSLPLEEFIRLATEKDTYFEEILINELTLKYKKAIALPAGDLVVSLKNQYDFLYEPNERDSENTISLSKLFPYIGTTIEADYSSSLNKTSRSVSSDFNASISQPIAENAFGKNTRLLDKITGIEIDVAEFQIIEAYEDYLAHIIQIYYDWYSAYKNLQTAENSYNENLKLLENIKERQRHKIALPVDVNKISLQVLAKKENLIALKNLHTDYLNMVEEAIRYKGPKVLQPKDPLLYAELKIDFEKDYNIFNEKSRTSRVLELLEVKSLLEVDRHADELLPSIDIFAGYTLEGSRHTLEKSEKTTYAGVTLDWPLPGVVERAEYETSKITQRKTELSSLNIHVRLYTDLKNLNESIEREKELIDIFQEKITLAQAIVDDDRANYSLGRVTLNDLIDEINRLEDNKFGKIVHTIELRKLILEWLRITDVLVRQDKVSEIKVEKIK